MTDSIEIEPTGPLRGSIRPPGSKSITNRALVCAALARGESLLDGTLDSEDTRVMIEALGQLGLVVEHDPTASRIRVVGSGGNLPALQGFGTRIGAGGTTGSMNRTPLWIVRSRSMISETRKQAICCWGHRPGRLREWTGPWTWTLCRTRSESPARAY